MSTARFFDTHAHLDYPQFANELTELVNRARAAGIEKIISIGTDLDSSRRAIQLAEHFEGVYAVVGWHPSDAEKAPADLRPSLRELARHPKVVALGETGLDYYHLPGRAPGGNADNDGRLKQRQAEVFHQHLEVAAETGLNCVIHQRDSMEDTIAQLAPFSGRLRAVFHCFTSDPGTLKRVLELNCLVSFTGIATFKNAATVRESIAAVPSGRFMLETDSPFLAPVPYRGKRCEPAYVREIAATVAGVRGCSLEDLSRITCDSAHEFFPKLD
jgi:TatD DNase family protein